MPFLEFEGKNIDKAIKKASEELNITVDKVVYDIISHGSTGIFGLVGTKKARIRVTIPEDLNTKSPLQTPLSNLSLNQKKKNHADNIDIDVDVDVEEDIDDISDDSLDHNEDFEEENFDEDDDIKDEDEKSKTSTEPSESTSQAIEAGLNVLKQIVGSITEETKFSFEHYLNRVLFKIEGGDTGSLIGKRGQTLEAIQYIIEKVVNKKSDQRVHVQVDVGGYIESRRKTLKTLASRLAEKVKRIGRPSSLGLLNAYDRKTVHVALKDNNDVRTQSIGDGYYRKLVIFPKKNYIPKKNFPA